MARSGLTSRSCHSHAAGCPADATRNVAASVSNTTTQREMNSSERSMADIWRLSSSSVNPMNRNVCRRGMSFNPSNPIPGLPYQNFDFERGLAHLAHFGVEYYVAYTPEAREKAAPALHDAKDRINTDVLPVLTAAVAAAGAATEDVRGETAKRGKAVAAALKGEVEAPKESHKLRTFLVLLGNRWPSLPERLLGKAYPKSHDARMIRCCFACAAAISPSSLERP